MELQHALLTRTTVHNYLPDPLPAEALERALAAAIAAPNHRMTEPWRFTHVGPAARADLAALAVELKRADAAAAGTVLPERTAEQTRAKMLGAPVLLVVSQALSPKPEVAEEDYAAVACAIQNFQLSLWAEGLGSKWSSGGVTTAPATYARLGIDPAGERIVGFVWAGFPADIPPKPRRHPVAERLRVCD